MNRNSILLISLFFFSLSVAAQSIYEGKLGGKYGVVIQLVRGEKSGRITEMEGTYYYTSKGPDNLIELSGIWNLSNMAFEIEEFEDGIPVGMFKGKFTDYGMEGVHTNYARNSNLSFRLKRTKAAYQSKQEKFGAWDATYKKDEFGDKTKELVATNKIQNQYKTNLYFLYSSDVGLEISSDFGIDLDEYTRVSFKRSDGRVERLQYRSYGNKLYVVNRDEINKTAQIMDDGNFKLLIEFLSLSDGSVHSSKIFNVKKELEGAQRTFDYINTHNR